MFCVKCGANVNDGAKFCPKCGAPVKAPSAVSEAASAVVSAVTGNDDAADAAKEAAKKAEQEAAKQAEKEAEAARAAAEKEAEAARAAAEAKAAEDARKAAALKEAEEAKKAAAKQAEELKKAAAAEKKAAKKAAKKNKAKLKEMKADMKAKEKAFKKAKTLYKIDKTPEAKEGLKAAGAEFKAAKKMFKKAGGSHGARNFFIILLILILGLIAASPFLFKIVVDKLVAEKNPATAAKLYEKVIDIDPTGLAEKLGYDDRLADLKKDAIKSFLDAKNPTVDETYAAYKYYWELLEDKTITKKDKEFKKMDSWTVNVLDVYSDTKDEGDAKHSDKDNVKESSAKVKANDYVHVMFYICGGKSAKDTNDIAYSFQDASDKKVDKKNLTHYNKKDGIETDSYGTITIEDANEPGDYVLFIVDEDGKELAKVEITIE